MNRRARRVAKTAIYVPTSLSAPRAILLLLTLLIFVLDGYATQTHIHVNPPVSGAYTAVQGSFAASVHTNSAKATRQATRDRYPPGDDPANCPICQQILHHGSFISPSAIAALPPALAVSIIAVVLDALIVQSPVSHSWHGRAPPLL